jgi:hypothetical protein
MVIVFINKKQHFMCIEFFCKVSKLSLVASLLSNNSKIYLLNLLAKSRIKGVPTIIVFYTFLHFERQINIKKNKLNRN